MIAFPTIQSFNIDADHEKSPVMVRGGLKLRRVSQILFGNDIELTVLTISNFNIKDYSSQI
jgi:hypothetical protein